MSESRRWLDDVDRDGLPSGPLVALETSGALGSVAAGHPGKVLARAFLPGARTHAARLVPALDGLLESAGIARADLGGVVVGAGPGSFTGVRVAAATAKGLAHALGLPLWAISSLEAAAVADRALADVGGPWEGSVSAGPGALRGVLFDARGDRVYAGLYRLAGDGLHVVEPPRAARLGEVLAEWPREDLHFVGDGANRHREAIVRAEGSVLPPPAGIPTADGLLHVLGLGRGRPPVDDPRRWEPEYLRMAGAERGRP